MFAEVRSDYPSECAPIGALTQMLGVGSPEMICTWAWRRHTDAGERPRFAFVAVVEIKRLRRESVELWRANETVKAASPFFASELDRPHKR